MTSHLIIPDAHAHPNHDNKRFSALGKLINELKPTKVICIGDFADMPSLSSFDKGRATFEGRRFEKDCEATRDAQDKLFAGINYSPKLYMLLGNHDGGRITRVANDNPELLGTIDVKKLRYEEYGWRVSPFQSPITLDGISYCHYFVSGVAGRPISGESIGKTLCNKLHISTVQGHSHIFDHSERTNAAGRKLFGMAVGCYTHPGMVEGWSRAITPMWWRGVVYLGDVDGHGYYDEIRAITLRKIMKDFR